MTGRERRELVSRGNHLAAAVTLSAESLGESGIAQVRTAFTHHELIKVRVQTPDRDAFGVAVETLVERVPCELVKKIGRIALLRRSEEHQR